MPDLGLEQGASLFLQSRLRIVDWGLIEYPRALQQQTDIVEDIIIGRSTQTVVFCSHPPVVTLGRGTKAGDVFGWKGEVVPTSRGGRATYHGPNQMVIYPLINLASPLRAGLAARDLHGYLRALERMVLQALHAAFGVQAQGSSLRKKISATSPTEATGVWVGDRKIASIGIGVRRWISYHGVAINVEHDERAFAGINPCGFHAQQMVSLEELIGRPPDRQALKAALEEELLALFSPNN